MEQFSPAELAELAFLARSAMDAQFQYWISITFAVVAAGFIAGKRLTQKMRYAVAVLYALATLLLIARFVSIAPTTNAVIAALEEAGVDIIPPVGWTIVASRYLIFGFGTVAALYFLLGEKHGRESDEQRRVP